MTKAKAKSKAIEACKATASGGALVCVLELGHAAAHSTAPRGRKPAQHATWAIGGDGKVLVSTYSSGKPMGSWPEDAPKVEAVAAATDGPILDTEQQLVRGHRRKQAEARAEATQRAKAKKKPAPGPRFCNEREGDTMRVCTLAPGHAGDHDSGVKTWPQSAMADDDPRPAWLRAQTAERDAAGRRVDPKKPCRSTRDGFPCQLPGDHDGDHLTQPTPGLVVVWNDKDLNSWMKCRAATANKGYACERPEEHDGSHRQITGSNDGLCFAEWADNSKRAAVQFIPISDGAAALLGKLTSDDDNEREAPALDEPELTKGKDKKRRAPTPTEPTPGQWGPISCTSEALRCKSTFVNPENGKPLKPELRCDLEADHTGKHRSPAPEGNHVAIWTDDKAGGAYIPLRKYDDARDRAIAECGDGGGPRDIACVLDEGHAGAHCDGAMTWGEGEAPPVTKSDHWKRRGADRGQTAPAEVPTGTTIGGHKVHPAAAIFPLIAGEDYTAFLEDLRTNGQRTPIVRIEVEGRWQILDGRNRLRGCIDLGLDPRFRTFGDAEGDGADPIAFVISENLNGRRHLNETQRAFVGAELVPLYEAEAKERQRAAGRTKGSLNLGEAQKGKATQHAAKAVNVSRASIEAALKVNREGAPEVIAAARERGQIKVSTAAELSRLPKSKQSEIVAKIGGGELRSGKVRALVNQEKKRSVVRKINEQRVAPMPGGPFGVIYGDYPWHYDNSDQHEGSRGHLGYPTMKMEQVLAHAFEAAKRAARDCIVALWTTNLYVTRMDRVLEAYGAERRTVLTWPKPKAGVGTWGRGQTEHLVIASIGEPVHTLNEVSTLLPSWKPARPGEHSSKPAEVAELLAKHCGGPFLELFAREPREGWATWGAEADGAAFELKKSKIYTATDERARAS